MRTEKEKEEAEGEYQKEISQCNSAETTILHSPPLKRISCGMCEFGDYMDGNLLRWCEGENKNFYKLFHSNHFNSKMI